MRKLLHAVDGGESALSAPGLSLLVIRAHHLLEMHTLTKWQIHWKNADSRC